MVLRTYKNDVGTALILEWKLSNKFIFFFTKYQVENAAQLSFYETSKFNDPRLINLFSLFFIFNFIGYANTSVFCTMHKIMYRKHGDFYNY